MDGLEQFKQGQKEAWKNFAPMETITTPAAARLVQFAGVANGMRVLDVGCGTGVVAITAARLGACVKAADLTPQLLGASTRERPTRRGGDRILRGRCRSASLSER